MNYLAQLNIFNVSKANFKETKKFLFCFKLLERKKSRVRYPVRPGFIWTESGPVGLSFFINQEARDEEEAEEEACSCNSSDNKIA